MSDVCDTHMAVLRINPSITEDSSITSRLCIDQSVMPTSPTSHQSINQSINQPTNQPIMPTTPSTCARHTRGRSWARAPPSPRAPPVTARGDAAPAYTHTRTRTHTCAMPPPKQKQMSADGDDAKKKRRSIERRRMQQMIVWGWGSTTSWVGVWGSLFARLPTHLGRLWEQPELCLQLRAHSFLCAENAK